MNDFLVFLNGNLPVLYTGTVVLGLLIGSFLNVVIHRTPKILEQEWKQQCHEMLEIEAPPSTPISLSKPNSTCPSCGHAIKPWENIPVISYLLLRGKCSGCKTGISIRYPIVEVVTSLLSLAIVFYFGATYLSIALLFFTWTLVSLTMIDADTQLLPDSMTLPLLWLGLIVNYFELIVPLGSALWGAIWGYMALWLVYQGFKLLTGKEGMGFGDFKLLAALGAWLGWQMLPIVILLSSLVGAVIGISMVLIKGKDKNIPIPFGPYLAIAGWITLIWGHDISRIWLG